jgi:hypothetical protein
VSGARPTPTFALGLPQTITAIAYAERKHAGQQRTDGTPFVQHPLEVALLLHDAGAPDHLVAAGALHDVLEKTDASAIELQRRFGSQITRLVTAVSDDDRIAGYASRKAALRRQVARAGSEALQLFAADKLSKLRELRRETELDPEHDHPPTAARSVRARRLTHYLRSLSLLEEQLPQSALVGELRSELRVFAAAGIPPPAAQNGPCGS